MDCVGIDCGKIAAEWFSDFLHTKCQLIQWNDNFERKKYGGKVQFADSSPLTIISESSLDTLNFKLRTEGNNSVSMDRFRPNIVVSGCEAHEEDIWKVIKVNNINLELIKPIKRCTIITINQQTGEKDSEQEKEPLKTLAKYRTAEIEGEQAVLFGQKATYYNYGEISKDDLVRVISFKESP